jgi:hypothetical protein
MSANIYRRGRGACAAAIPANSSLLSTTSPLYLRRLTREIRRAFVHVGVYYCHQRIFSVRFRQGRIQFQQALGERWRWASKPELFINGYGRQICASREQTRRGGAR